jgi:hypothetical protein
MLMIEVIGNRFASAYLMRGRPIESHWTAGGWLETISPALSAYWLRTDWVALWLLRLQFYMSIFKAR